MIISNHLIGKMPIPDDAVIRVNLAWVKSYEEAEKIIEESEHDIYLDFPSGRTKPPVPTITLKEALELAKFSKVKYFAISNAEDINLLVALMAALDGKELVPKIETARGVQKLPEMAEAGIKTVMLDKEDLYVSLHGHISRYNELVEEVRSCGIKVLELVGVCFQ